MKHYVIVDEFGLGYVYDDKDKLIADVIQEQRNYDGDQTEEIIVKETESREQPNDLFYLSVDNPDGYCTSYCVYVCEMNSGIVH